MSKMNEQQKKRIANAAQGLKKLTPEQEQAIKKLYETNDERFKEVEKIVHKSVLYAITGDVRFAPKSNRNERAEQLNAILFS